MGKAKFQKSEFHISGMSCAACVNRVERKLKSNSFVQSAQVLLPTETATVIYEAEHLNEQQIIQLIHDSGYEGELVQANQEEVDDSKMTGVLLAKIIVSLTVAVAFMIFGMTGDLPGQLQLLIVLPIQFYCGYDFLKGMVRSFYFRNLNMDTLVGIGTLSAFLYSTFVVMRSYLPLGEGLSDSAPGVATRGHMVHSTGPSVYFETVAFLIGFILLGRYLEARAKRRTGSALNQLLHLAPQTARVKRHDTWSDLPVAEILEQDVIQVATGERFPVDGEVILGQGSVDESMLTGENMPVLKTVSSQVFSGTVNLEGALEFRATKVGEQTLLAQIASMVKSAQSSKAPIQKLADRVSAVFVPIILVLAVLTFLIWYFALGHNFEMSFLYGLSVVVISCPCALGLATPSAVVVGVGRAATHGLLVRDAEALQLLEKVSVIAFDKTGTLTRGRPEVTKFILASGVQERDVLEKVLVLEQSSRHPLAQAISRYCEDRGAASSCSVDQAQTSAGLGLQGVVDGHLVMIGSEKYLSDQGVVVSTITTTEAAAQTLVFAAIDRVYVGVFSIEDELKPEANSVISDFEQRHIETHMISGDRDSVAQSLGRKIKISKVWSEVLPQDKAEIIQKLKAQKSESNSQKSQRESSRIVAMVGDGINDAPALTSADVSFAMGSGSDIAIKSASVTILNGNLQSILTAIDISGKTMRTIRENLFFSFIYNLLAIPVAAGFFWSWGLQLSPMLAGLAMTMSSITVVSNSLRLRWR